MTREMVIKAAIWSMAYPKTNAFQREVEYSEDLREELLYIEMHRNRLILYYFINALPVTLEVSY